MFHHAKINVQTAVQYQIPSVTILMHTETAVKVELVVVESIDGCSKRTVKKLVTFVSQIVFDLQNNKSIVDDKA